MMTPKILAIDDGDIETIDELKDLQRDVLRAVRENAPLPLEQLLSRRDRLMERATARDLRLDEVF